MIDLNTIIVPGHVLDVLQEIPDEIVQTIVTSPPYFGLRDYGIAPSPWPEVRYSPMPGLPELVVPAMDACLGLEPSIEAFVGHLVLIWRGLRRVLRDDGTCWLNLGDSYRQSGGFGHRNDDTSTMIDKGGQYRQNNIRLDVKRDFGGLKPKNLMLIPVRVALALQADGWWVRSDIVWHKINPMPESAKDRPSKSWEHIFLLTKRSKYYYDPLAIMEPAQMTNKNSDKPALRNRRDVWSMVVGQFKGAHFSTYPLELPKVCIGAGTSEYGCCSVCGASWRNRIVIPEHYKRIRAQMSGWSRPEKSNVASQSHHRHIKASSIERGDGRTKGKYRGVLQVETTGWEPACECNADVIPCLVLDPFCGSGTTGLATAQLGRRFIGVDQNSDYVEMAEDRIRAWKEENHK